MINNFSKYGFPFYRIPPNYSRPISYNKKTHPDTAPKIENDINVEPSIEKKRII